MAIIPQQTLFRWENDINILGDLERLNLVLENIPDEKLVRKLEDYRGYGRNDFPVRAMWNMQIAKFVFGHDTQESIIRELNRNVQLRYVCGFYCGKIPRSHNVTRFLDLLAEYDEEANTMFVRLTEILGELLSDFGENMALDSKWIPSKANKQSTRKKPDGRSETDAKKGTKTYSGVHKDGTVWKTEKTCFGFKIHLLVDAKYELPIAFCITDAATSDIVVGRDLIELLTKQRPEILEGCKYLTADKGYDDTDIINMLLGVGTRAVIDKRTMWKAQTEKQVPGYENAYYDEHGNVYCYSPETAKRNLMTPNGYELERDSSRFACPAQAKGITCKESANCHCKNVRISGTVDRRVFPPVQRETYKWERLYKTRTSVERVNSRLDVSFGFEARTTRGVKRMKTRCVLAMITMLGLAVGRIKNNQEPLIRSLIKAA